MLTSSYEWKIPQRHENQKEKEGEGACTKIWCRRDFLRGCNLPHFCLHMEWWEWGIHMHPPCSWHYRHTCRNHIAHDLDLFNRNENTEHSKLILHWLSTSLTKLCGYEHRYVASCVNNKNWKIEKNEQSVLG